ncbi:hypothetical protein [Leadbettera azotonutricia]|uniref:Putative lipoprotein n=1 Tax=Leadbettera azotonutricia (strain ATCC BAA-888 / DSM 13862 / ZAS-9) TaxID=545695 RepID=F5YDL6_LEAAZ|nr:hypothetical protein [Leadbettera azotonutricia]AEF82615.1 putative lipoprotein [Leadbettera azotonutricia ZAS-9]
MKYFWALLGAVLIISCNNGINGPTNEKVEKIDKSVKTSIDGGEYIDVTLVGVKAQGKPTILMSAV